MEVLTIGMLARNEADAIGTTIASLLDQSIFRQATATSLGVARIELIIVPNGCTDNTAEVARSALAQLNIPNVRAAVREQPAGGKSRAWNTLVHELAPPETSLFVFVDADILIGDNSVVEQLIRGLQAWPDAMVTTSEPLKQFSSPKHRSLQQRFSRQASTQASDPHAICGQLYCARADAMRRIWLPVATPGEDGFLCAMVKTEGFTRQPVEKAVRRVPGAHHFYKPDDGVAGFIRHEARLLAGTTVNIFLFEHLWGMSGEAHLGALVDRRNRENPDWVDDLVAERTQGRRWRLPKKLLFTRLRPIRAGSRWSALVRAPVALAATLISIVPSIRANRILGRGGAAKHW